MLARVCRSFLFAAAFSSLFGIGAGHAADSPSEASNPEAVALANKTLEVMGGRSAWDQVRVLKWSHMGKRLHYWDKMTGDVRIEADSTLILMNIDSKKGRVWQSGVEVTDEEVLEDKLDDGYGMWVNDSYWLVMPYKLLDPGVRLSDPHDTELQDGRPADSFSLTFENVGLTPENKYDVWIAQDTGLVEQWAYYEKATDADPKFKLPWKGWKKFGPILLATEHGRPGEADMQIEVFEERPAKVFETP